MDKKREPKAETSTKIVHKRKTKAQTQLYTNTLTTTHKLMQIYLHKNRHAETHTKTQLGKKRLTYTIKTQIKANSELHKYKQKTPRAPVTYISGTKYTKEAQQWMLTCAHLY